MPSASKATVPADFVLSAEPAGVKDLMAVKADAKDGDEVVVRAVAGGSEKPFSTDQAVVQVIDRSVPTCDKMGMDCPTPWDACCHQDVAVQKGATMKLLDAAGKPVSGTLDGVAGLKPGKAFIVKGIAKLEGEKKELVIDATNIYVAGS